LSIFLSWIRCVFCSWFWSIILRGCWKRSVKILAVGCAFCLFLIGILYSLYLLVISDSICTSLWVIDRVQISRSSQTVCVFALSNFNHSLLISHFILINSSVQSSSCLFPIIILLLESKYLFLTLPRLIQFMFHRQVEFMNRVLISIGVLSIRGEVRVIIGHF